MVSPSPRPDPIQRPAERRQPERQSAKPERHEKPERKERPVAKDRVTATRPVDDNLRQQQQKAVDEGFLMPVDGIDGPQTREMFAKYREWKAEKVRAEAAASQADARAKAETAAAEAEKSKAAAALAAAEAEKTKAAAAAAKAESDRLAAAEKSAADERQQAIKTGMTVAFPLAGAAVGHKIATAVTAKDAASIAARAKNLSTIAKDVEKQIKTFEKAKGGAKTLAKKGLVGSVAAADKLQLTRTKGPMAAIIAGMLVAEGAFSRFVAAPQVSNEVAKEALLQASSASLFAATTLLGERALARATPIAGPAAKDLAALEKARAVTAPAKTVAGNLEKRALQLTAPAKKGAAPAGGLLGKLAVGVGVVTAVAAIVQSARAEGTSGALTTAAKMVDPTGLVAKLTEKTEEPSIRDLARQQAEAREGGRLEQVPDTVTAHIADDVRSGLTPPGQGELMRRVANAGLDNFYAGPRPAEFDRRASTLALAGVAAREVNARPSPEPQMDAIPAPPPAPSAHEQPKPRHVWDDYAREKAAEARRMKGENNF